ncbi:MAG: hypothetical protein WC263_02730 [Candidatus Micrarchaeia archaeon]
MRKHEQIRSGVFRPRIASAIRNAAIFGAVAVPLLLSAQIKQIEYPKDSLGNTLEKKRYASFKENRGEQPAAITFVGTFSGVYIRNHPRKELKINDAIVLSVEDQVALRKHPFLTETKNYVFLYATEIDGVQINCLTVWKKTSPSQPSDTFK